MRSFVLILLMIAQTAAAAGPCAGHDANLDQAYALLEARAVQIGQQAREQSALAHQTLQKVPTDRRPFSKTKGIGEITLAGVFAAVLLATPIAVTFPALAGGFVLTWATYGIYEIYRAHGNAARDAKVSHEDALTIVPDVNQVYVDHQNVRDAVLTYIARDEVPYEQLDFAEAVDLKSPTATDADRAVRRLLTETAKLGLYKAERDEVLREMGVLRDLCTLAF